MRNLGYGLKIKSAELKNNEFLIYFDCGRSIIISDKGQICCEYRYMTTDDNPKSLAGQILQGIEEKPLDSTDDGDGGSHDTIFVEIKTNLGIGLVLVCHNENSGYYGGFDLNVKNVPKQ